MALVVETGTGSATAESYISVADATTYHAARGNAAWATLASDMVREQLLRKATAYMLQAYRFRWAGTRHHDTQALDWPRLYVPKKDYGYTVNYYDPNSVPADVANACAELALKASSADLYADQKQAIKRKKIGPLAFEYDEFSPQEKRYVAIEAMLAPYFASSGNALKAVRV